MAELRGALEDEPALHPVRVGELVNESRLAHPGLADDRRYLAVIVARSC